MIVTTYLLSDGVFMTTDQPYDGEYIAMFPVSDADYIEINRGADLRVENGALVITPVPIVEEIIEAAQ
jgi:hypothetical protein